MPLLLDTSFILLFLLLFRLKQRLPPQNSARTPPTLHSLPFDVCVEIFSYLTVKELIYVERASSYLHRFLNSHYVWSRVVSDIQQIKPLPFRVDPDAMTKEELKAMAIRAFRIHKFPSSPSSPGLVYRVPQPGDIAMAYMFPRGRYVTLDDEGRLRLVSINSGLLDSLPALTERPKTRGFNKFTPIQASMKVSYLMHCINYFSTYPAIRNSVIRLYAVTDRFKLIRDVSCRHWVVSCSASGGICAYAWMGPRSQCYVRFLPIEGTSRVPIGGCEIELSGYDTDEHVYDIPRPCNIAMPSDEYLILATRLCICVYHIPTPLSDGMVLIPFWTHVPLNPYRKHDPYILAIPPLPDQRDQLRFAIYDAGVARMFQISTTPLMREITLSHFYRNVPFFHLGAVSALTADEPVKKFHSVCPFALFLYTHRLDSLTDRLQVDSLITHGVIKLYGDTENHYPTVLSLDEDSGLLLFISLSHVVVYSFCQ